MIRKLTLAALVAVLPGAASAQTLSVLHIKVTLINADGIAIPIPNHPLLISDNPSTSTPRRVVTGNDGTADVRLRPGNYTVESDEPLAFNGKGYQWTQILDVPAGRDIVLELTSANAEVGGAPPPSPSSAPKENEPSLLAPSKDSVTIWTPESRAEGFLVDPGLVVTSQKAIGRASAVEVQFTPVVKVAARVVATDPATDIAVLRIDPAGTLLPVEPPTPVPAATLDAEAKRRVGNLSSYRMSSSDFDIAFLTPVLVHAAQQGPQAATTGFGDWSEYFAEGPRVLVVRVTPKLTESFWTTVARGAAYTQGAALPPIKHFKPGFSRLRVLCGDVEVTPIHPFILNQRVSDTDAVREGLYVFDPQALGRRCTAVKLVLYSEKAPEKPDTRTVDPNILERISKDFVN